MASRLPVSRRHLAALYFDLVALFAMIRIPKKNPVDQPSEPWMALSQTPGTRRQHLVRVPPTVIVQIDQAIDRLIDRNREIL